MADTFDPQKRSWLMSQVHSKDTSIEIRVRRWLFHKGYRFRKNVSSLPGKPDVVLNGYKTAVFIQGCFWHRHPGCNRASIPKTRVDFWKEKFEKNKLRDTENEKKLNEMGYRVIILWECEIRKNFEGTMNRVAEMLGVSRSNIQ